MRTVTEDNNTITIQFTREEARNLRSTASYVSSLFEHLDREALDGYHMTMDEAHRLTDEFSRLTTAYLGESGSSSNA